MFCHHYTQGEITSNFARDPTLVTEEHYDGDLFSQLFPAPKNSRMHGLGLLVGGRSTKLLEQAVLALRDSRSENLELRGLVETMMIKSQQMEKKLNSLLASQENKQTQGEEIRKEAHEQEEDPTAAAAANILAALSASKREEAQTVHSNQEAGTAGKGAEMKTAKSTTRTTSKLATVPQVPPRQGISSEKKSTASQVAPKSTTKPTANQSTASQVAPKSTTKPTANQSTASQVGTRPEIAQAPQSTTNTTAKQSAASRPEIAQAPQSTTNTTAKQSAASRPEKAEVVKSTTKTTAKQTTGSQVTSKPGCTEAALTARKPIPKEAAATGSARKQNPQETAATGLSRKPVEEETAATGPASKTIQEESPATTAPTISSVAAHKTGLNEVSASGVTSGLVKTVLRMSRNQSNNREASETEEHAAVTTRATTNVTAPDNLTSSQPCATISVRESLQKIMGQMLPPKTAGAAPTENKTKNLDRKSSQLVGSQVGSEMQTKSKRTKKRKLEDIVAEKEETKIQEDKLE
jgi:hypothetical protein